MMNGHSSHRGSSQLLQPLNQLEQDIQKISSKVEESNREFRKAASMMLRNEPLDEHLEALSKDRENYFKERRWRKRKIYSKLSGSHLFHPMLFDSPSPENSELSSNAVADQRAFTEQVPKPSYFETLVKQPFTSAEFSQPIQQKSYLVSEDLLHSSANISSSFLSGHSYGFNAAENINGGVTGTVEKEHAGSQRVMFSRWEEQFLNQELPGVQLPSSCKEPPDALQTYVKVPVTTAHKPLLKTAKVSPPLKTLDAIGGTEKLNMIIEMQKQRNLQKTAELQNDSLFDYGVSNRSKRIYRPIVPKVKTVDVATDTATLPDADKECQTGLFRKIATVPPPKPYKGFSAVDKQTESPSKDIPENLPSQKKNVTKKSPKRTHINAPQKFRQEDDSREPPPCVILLDSKFIPKENSSSNSSPLVNLDAPAGNTDNNVPTNDTEQTNVIGNVGASQEPDQMIGDETQPKTIELIDLTGSPPQSTRVLRSDNKENDSPSVDEDLAIVHKILEDIENNVVANVEKRGATATQECKPIEITMRKSKKRKASKQPEAKAPASKSNPYNRSIIMEYIEKQRLQRKKQLREERKKRQEAEQLKKERLQQVYEHQKLAVAKSLPTQPLKPLYENVKSLKTREGNEPSPHGSPAKSTAAKVQSPKKIVTDSATAPAGRQLPGIIFVDEPGKLKITSNEVDGKKQSVKLVQKEENAHPEIADQGEIKSLQQLPTVGTPSANLVELGKGMDTGTERVLKDTAVSPISQSEKDIGATPPSAKINSLPPASQLVEELLPKVLSSLEDRFKLARPSEVTVNEGSFSIVHSSSDVGTSQVHSSVLLSQSYTEDIPVRDKDYHASKHEFPKHADLEVQIKKPSEKDLTETVPKTKAVPLAKLLNMSEWDYVPNNPNPYNFISTFQRKPLVLHRATDESKSNLQIEIASELSSPTSDILSGRVEPSYSKESYSSKFSLSDARSFESNTSSETIVSEKASISENVESGQKNNNVGSYTIGQEDNGTTVSSAFSATSQILEGTLPNNVTRTKDDELSSAESKSVKIFNREDTLNEDVSVLTSVRSENNIKTSETLEEDSNKVSGDQISSAIIENVANTSDDVEDIELKLDSEKSASPAVSVPSTKHSRSSNESIESFHSAKFNVPDSNSKSSPEVDEDLNSLGSSQDTPHQESENGGLSSARSGKGSHSTVTQSANSNGPTITEQKIEKAAPSNYTPVQPTTFFDTGIVTRVVAEAASAAATSAVIAALEYQKILPSKKQLMHMTKQQVFGSDKEYSPDFESSKSSRSASAASHISPSATKSSIKTSSRHPSEQSIAEAIPSFDLEEPRSASAVSKPSYSPIGSHSKSASDVSKKYMPNKSHYRSETDEEIIEEAILSKGKLKGLNNVSSPSPASLSENESLPSTSVSSFASSLSGMGMHSRDDDALSGSESFTQLTIDMVKHMTEDEEIRARQQLSLLQFQEKALVEKARAELKWLELLKRKLQEKNAFDKLPVVRKRQQELMLRLRQERAQLRCLQETYRGVIKKHRSHVTEKKKLLTAPALLSSQLLQKKESQPISLDKLSEKASHSTSASLPSVSSVATAVQSAVDSHHDSEIPEVVAPSGSSAESVAESPDASASKPSDTYTPELTTRNEASSSGKTESTPYPSQVSGHSLESDMKGIKRLEANKRYLTKKEQRLVQRRTHAESLLQWQKKLDQEEKEVKLLEQKAVEVIEKNKHRSKYYVSTSTPASSKSDAQPIAPENLSSVISRGLSSDLDMDVDSALPTHSTPQQQDSSSVPEESSHLALAASDDKTSDEIHTASSNNEIGTSTDKSKTGSGSSAVADEAASAQVSSQSSVVEDVIESKSDVGSSTKIQSSSSFVYSESFASLGTTKSQSPSEAVDLHVSSVKKHNHVKSPTGSIFPPMLHRRHDSSGSDDSFTKSHSETASDQSDIEGRIYALTEELQQRQAIAKKLKREQKKKRFEQLREKEQSLQKQLESLHKYIMETSMELEQQLDAVSSGEAAKYSVVTVKPQIKQPRVAKSRHLQKQPRVVLEPEPFSIKNVEGSDQSTPSDDKEVPLLPRERKPQSSSHLAKKLRAIEMKEVPDESTSPHTLADSTSSVSGKTGSQSSQGASGTEEPILTEDGSKVSLGAGTESSLSYSSDFVLSEDSVGPKNSDGKTPESSFTDGGDTSNEAADNRKSEDQSLDELIEGSLEDSQNSVLSVKTLQKKSHSLEGDESFESVVEDEVEEKIESESCNGSDGCPSLKNALNSTFVVHGETEVISGGGDFLDPKRSEKQDASIPEPLSVNKENSKQMHLKPEFVDNFVDYILISLCEDASNAVCKLLPMAQRSHKVVPIVTEPAKAKTLTVIHEKIASKVSQNVTSSLLEEAVIAVLKVFKKMKLEHKHLEGNKKDLAVESTTNSECTYAKNISSNNISETIGGIVTFPDDMKAEDALLSAASEELPKDHSSPKWFYDDTFIHDSRNKLSPLDQQLFVQQYPYYYRQIPNKPPPPYTPPSTPLVQSAQTSTSKPEVKAEPKVTVVQKVTRILDDIVDRHVDMLIKRKSAGIALKDVEGPQKDVESSDLLTQSQFTFEKCTFELARETALKLYVDNKSEIKHRPWLRNQRLTPKPVFPLDKNQVLPPLLKEVRRVLRVDAGAPEKQTIWSIMKLGRKKRDFVDTIIINELKEEEQDWVCYDEDEFAVKLQLTNSIFSVLMNDAIAAYKNARQMKVPDL